MRKMRKTIKMKHIGYMGDMGKTGLFKMIHFGTMVPNLIKLNQ